MGYNKSRSNISITNHSIRNYLVFLFIVLVSKTTSGWDISSASSGSDVCAEIFLEENYKGKSFYLKDSEHVSDLSKIHEQLGTEDLEADSRNGTISFKIQPTCTLITADRTKLRGKSYEFDTDMESIPLSNQKPPQSAACTCPKICQCEDAVLRQQECARAYLRKDCRHCDAFFTSMTQDTKETFPTKWANDVVSLLVKKGCQVTLGVTDQEPSSVIVSANSTSNKVEPWNSTVTTYECSCDPAIQFKKTVSPPGPNDPPSIILPKTRKDMLSMLSQEPLLEHPGILAALQSVKNGRSPTNAYILVLGLTGAGKSSAINLLFDNPNITRVGGMVSTTTDIHEFRMRVKVNELGLNNTELRVIDTPGIADTRGIQQDAKFLATLDEYLKNHEDLKDRLPNVVLIFSKFHDNRYNGEGSSFVKMLRTIDLFKDRLIDRKYTNVIFVMTHYMSETKDIQRNPSERLSKIRKVIEEFSTIPKPIHIVVAENKAEQAHLPRLNGYYQLPNGEFYPKNLFDQIQQTLLTSGDPLGESVIRTGFKNSDNFRVIAKNFELVPDTNPEVTKFLGILSSIDMPADTTEISTALTESFEQMDPELKKRFPGSSNHLSKFLFQRNIHQKSDLPKTTVQILKLLQDIIINPASIFLLENALSITIPIFKGNLLVGSTYDLLNDKPMPTPIFDMSDLHPSEIGFQVPNGLNIVLQNRMQSTFYVFTDRDAYVKTRIGNLGIEPSSVPSGVFTGEIKDGFNIVNATNDSESLLESGKFSAVIEYHMFLIGLGKDLRFTSEFRTILENLSPFNQSDWENFQSWSRFFKMYGTHAVSAASGGGSVNIALAIGKEYEAALSKTEQYNILTDSMARIVQHLADGLKGIDTILEFSDKVTFEISVEGGDNKASKDGEFSIDLWKDSVYYNPVMLPTYLDLLPISDLVRLSNYTNAALMIEEAAAALFNASLVYVPVGKLNFDSATSRDRTAPELGELSGGDYQMVQQFSGIFKMMAEETQKMQDKMLMMMAKGQEESQRQVELYAQQRALDQEIRFKEEEIKREQERIKEDRDLQREALQMQNMQNLETLRIEKDKLAMQTLSENMRAMSESQAQQQSFLMQYINAENQRIHEAALSQANRPSLWEKITGTITGIFGQVAPIATTAAMFGR